MTPLNKETIDGILELAGGEDFILVELFQSFLEDTKELAGSIQNATNVKDWEKLKFDVHTLKGLCGTIGAGPLFEVCKVLNDDLKDGDLSSAQNLSKRVQEEYEALVKYITTNYKIDYDA